MSGIKQTKLDQVEERKVEWRVKDVKEGHRNWTPKFHDEVILSVLYFSRATAVSAVCHRQSQSASCYPRGS